MAKVLI